MPIDPILAQFLPRPALEAGTDFTNLREQHNADGDAMTLQVAEPGPEVADRRVVTIPVADGTIELIVFRPTLEEALPAHIYIHGGGWVAGTAHSLIVDIVCRERAVGAHCVAIAVNYRKAPEFPYPIALMDCEAALTWVHEHAEEIGVDLSIITVGGGSAGANLAAALTLKARDNRGPKIAFQLLEVPALDLTLSLPSHLDPDLGTNYALHRSDGDVLIDAYLGEDGDRQDPYASPLYAGNFSGLPPARILSAEFDMLRDDGGEYAQRLREAGVPVEFTLEPGHVHNSASFTKIMPAARAWRESAVAALRAFFWSTEPRPSGGEEFQELEDELNFTTSAALQQEL